MTIIRNLKLKRGETEDKLKILAARELKINPNEIKQLDIIKKSLDSRKKASIVWIYSVRVFLQNEEISYEKYEIPSCVKPKSRPVIVGFGPAGMFSALVLSKAGLCPIILERGDDVDTRQMKIDEFRQGGKLDTESNVQFGAGGAGTFSDGKLNTGTHNERIKWVLEQFHAHGAKESILYEAKPHLGTDVLVDVVRNIGETVTKNGGEIRYRNKLEKLNIIDGKVVSIEVKNATETYTLDCEQLILAIGHSARDSFEMLHSLNVPMQAKAFSMGARIEHKQTLIDKIQYGAYREELPTADYAVNAHLPNGTSAYTFCMCPGGEVFASSSEEGTVLTNGMSYSKRDGENANSALLVTLQPEDFPYEGVLGGMYWQREIEKRAYEYGGGNYKAPCQLLGDFMKNIPSTGCKSVKPTYKPDVVYGDICEVLPKRITDVLREAIPALNRKMRGFDNAHAVLTAPETRSSSPVRILREKESCMSEVVGLYPCGEGAGYAGGITSAAVDGIRCAEKLLEKYTALGSVS